MNRITRRDTRGGSMRYIARGGAGRVHVQSRLIATRCESAVYERNRGRHRRIRTIHFVPARSALLYTYTRAYYSLRARTHTRARSASFSATPFAKCATRNSVVESFRNEISTSIVESDLRRSMWLRRRRYAYTYCFTGLLGIRKLRVRMQFRD